MERGRLENDDVNVVVDALQKQLAFVVDDLPALRGAKGAHEGLEDVGTTVVVEELAELDAAREIREQNRREC